MWAAAPHSIIHQFLASKSSARLLVFPCIPKTVILYIATSKTLVLSFGSTTQSLFTICMYAYSRTEAAVWTHSSSGGRIHKGHAVCWPHFAI